MAPSNRPLLSWDGWLSVKTPEDIPIPVWDPFGLEWLKEVEEDEMDEEEEEEEEEMMDEDEEEEMTKKRKREDEEAEADPWRW